MAKIIEVKRQMVNPIKSVTITLSYDEASVIRDIAYIAAGDPDRSRRKFIADVGRALDKVGISPAASGPDVYLHGISRKSVLVFE